MSNDLIAFLGDTHFGDRGDNQITQAMQIRYFDEYFFPDILNRGIKYIIQFGDLMDKRKSTNHLTLSILRKHFLEKCEEYGIHCMIIIGNHDIFYRDSNEVSTIEEFIRGYKFVHAIKDNSTIKLGSNKLEIDLIPWINKENRLKTAKFIQASKSKYCIGHFEFSGFRFSKGGHVNDKGMGTALFSKYQHVYSGHYHTRSTQDNITYIGTPYELTWADYDDPKGYTVFNTLTGDTDFIVNPITLHNKIVYNDTINDPKDYLSEDYSDFSGMLVELHVNNKTNKKMFDKFVKHLYSFNPANLEIIDNSMKVTYQSDLSVNSSTDTKTLLDNGVKQVKNATIDQDHLQKIADDIYTEAKSVGTI